MVTEESIARSLRTILDKLPTGAIIEPSDELREYFSGLEYFVPQVLREIHPEWNHESLDGFLPKVARKTGEGEAEFFGHCILISDQTLTPIHLCLQIDLTEDEVLWLVCKLGERGDDGMMRVPYESIMEAYKRLISLGDHPDKIDWVYKVTFGHRRPSAV